MKNLKLLLVLTAFLLGLSSVDVFAAKDIIRHAARRMQDMVKDYKSFSNTTDVRVYFLELIVRLELTPQQIVDALYWHDWKHPQNVIEIARGKLFGKKLCSSCRSMFTSGSIMTRGKCQSLHCEILNEMLMLFADASKLSAQWQEIINEKYIIC